jgi:hypothetical protein
MEDKDYETEEAMLIRILRVQNEIRELKKQREELIEELRIQDERLSKVFQKD